MKKNKLTTYLEDIALLQRGTGECLITLATRPDIMRPGITKIDPTIKKGEIIEIVDETHNRALAVGKALFNAEEMKKKTSGKVIKNLHTIKKDPVWTFAKDFK